MTTLSSPPTGREPGRERGRERSLPPMAWVVWRQHRAALTCLGTFLLALATVILVAGIKLHGLYAAEIRHGCFGSSAWSSVCRPLQTPFTVGWAQNDASLVVLAMQAVPVIVGVFLGAPLLAREYRDGTVRFAWTQGIGRTRWTAATLGLLGAVVAVTAGLLGLLAQWSVQPIAAQTVREADRWEPGFFGSTVLTEATAALLAFAIGVLAGALIRRVVAAMAVTAVGAITVAGLTYNRLHYWLVGQGASLARDLAFGASPNVAVPFSGVIDIHEPVGPSVPGPAGAWLDQGWYTDAHGHRLSGDTLNRLLDRYTGTSPAWLTRLHDTFWVSYQPAGRYWVFQSAVGGGTLVVALLLGAVVIGLVRYRRA
jgi:ABC-type transport system involved in multi-copper enzyme maturation permease subunit